MQFVRPLAAAQGRLDNLLAHVEGSAPGGLHLFGDLVHALGDVLPAGVQLDGIQLAPDRANIVSSLFAGSSHIIQFGLHRRQLGLCGKALLPHVLEGYRCFFDAAFAHGLQGFLALVDHFGLLPDLLLQQFGFVLHILLSITVHLELLLIEFQFGVESFDGGFALFHRVLELLNAADAHFDIYARHLFTSPAASA